ncbi:MAG: hypothetical protein HYW37_01460 [Candidatus Colwellbacteria bacterium]|nr:hypothetical protein [Candidatus Colwellbacteria bacterium]
MKYLSSIYLVLIGSNLFVWYWIFNGSTPSDLNLYFLDVGQGDSELLKLPGGVKVLIDGGPGKAVLGELARALPATERYIDLVMLSHPQLDHFTGLISVMERYKIGAFIYNGREGETTAWRDLKRVLEEKKINVLILAEGDKIKYSGTEFDFFVARRRIVGQ